MLTYLGKSILILSSSETGKEIRQLYFHTEFTGIKHAGYIFFSSSNFRLVKS